MPQLIHEDRRMAALAKIESDLSVVKSINQALQEESTYTVSVSTSDAKATCKILLETKDTPKLLTILQGQKQRLIKDIQSLASKHRIFLDEQDLACMEGTVSEKKRRRRHDVEETAPESMDEISGANDNQRSIPNTDERDMEILDAPYDSIISVSDDWTHEESAITR